MPAQHPEPDVAEARAVATFDSFEEARATQNYLLTHGLAPDELTIIGTDVRLVERRMGADWWRSVITVGLLTGLVWGAGLALVLWLLIPGVSLVRVIVTGLLCGLVYGFVTALVTQGMGHAEHDPAWSMQPVARAYAVQAHGVVADQAKALLRQRNTGAEADKRPAEKMGPVERIPTRQKPRDEARTVAAAPAASAPGPARRGGHDAEPDVVAELETTAARRYRLDL